MENRQNEGLVRELCEKLSAVAGLPYRVAATRAAVGTAEHSVWATLNGDMCELRRYLDGTVLYDVSFTLNYSYPDISEECTLNACDLLSVICRSICEETDGITPGGSVSVRRDGTGIGVCYVKMSWRREMRRGERIC